MSFIQPWIFLAIPLALLPIAIHLLNQWRYQTRPWGAMMFLLQANRQNRGYTKVRKWLILTMRVVAVLGMIFLIARPLSSGLLGLFAGMRTDLTIILLDRSASMGVTSRIGGETKLDTGLRKLAQSLEKLDSNRYVLIDSVSNAAHEYESLESLLASPYSSLTSVPSDWQAMLESAADHIRITSPGPTSVWICSDLETSDWQPNGGRWESIRQAFTAFPQDIRCHILGYDEPADRNMAVTVTSAKRQVSDSGPELVLDIEIARTLDWDADVTIPLTIAVGKSRFTENVTVRGPQFDLKGYRVPLPSVTEMGWGEVRISPDTWPEDDVAYFVFEPSPPRKTFIVCDDESAVAPISLAAQIAPDGYSESSIEILPREELLSAVWEDVSLLIWQGRLPADEEAPLVEQFATSGGTVLFLPPERSAALAGMKPSNSDLSTFLGIGWQDWRETPSQVSNWRSDQDILASTQNGSALPLGQLQVNRNIGITGSLIPLATLTNSDVLIGKAIVDRGNVYFCTTLPTIENSSLAGNGIVLYIAVQRALGLGQKALGNTQSRRAARGVMDLDEPWRPLATVRDSLSTDYGLHAGIFSNEQELLAINRTPSENQLEFLNDEQLAQIFDGLSFRRIQDVIGSQDDLIQEAWRTFLFFVLIALIAEAILSLPPSSRLHNITNSQSRTGEFRSSFSPKDRSTGARSPSQSVVRADMAEKNEAQA